MIGARRTAARAALGIALALTFGCENSAAYTPFLTCEFPEIPEGSTQFTVDGNFFAPGAVVFWNGKPQVTHFVSTTQLAVDVDASLTTGASQPELTAQNPGSLLSAGCTFGVREAQLELTAVSPQQIPLNAPDTGILLAGGGFRATDVVLWNGVPLAATMQSSTALAATVPASLLTVAGDGVIQVSDPACTLGGRLCTKLSVFSQTIHVGGSTWRYRGSDVAWDATDSLLLFSSDDGLARLDGVDEFMTALDPAASTFVQTSPLYSSKRRRLAVSDRDRFVYSFGDGVEPVRYSLPGLSNAVTLTGFFTSSVAPAPGAPTTVALVAFKAGTGTAALQIIDDTVARANTADNVGVVEWGADASTL